MFSLSDRGNELRLDCFETLSLLGEGLVWVSKLPINFKQNALAVSAAHRPLSKNDQNDSLSGQPRRQSRRYSHKFHFFELDVLRADVVAWHV